ncbi:MAG: phosphatidylethanolamine-binding protein [Candidatus Woykebacteria bacterium RBG_16_43_9]|uniref:Phosphatidylethanolamine-binding protein n=1 Tax=Candidatus Woykebacteria bacterium RBG_16_43_9 TaxID=1802596 RepID=A0A1G1WGK3_9BACT|nr:MAG: phosphatidylethanolamine-binding protein [Candidatus Woykebacteria bacterium RBG_16_43_9]
MQITSTAFSHNNPIPAKYTCDGKDFSPPLQFSDVPANTKSLVLIVDDPDALGKTWVHWTVWNIDPQTAQIPEGEFPNESVQGVTDFGEVGYGGPCPPGGTHRYFFKLYALDNKLDLPYEARKEDIEKEMKGHIITKAELIGTYSKKSNQ